MKKFNYFTSILIILVSLNLTAQPGQLDQTFGDQGKVIFNYGMDYDYYAYDVAIQSDGKIVIVGSMGLANNKSDVFIMRLKDDGSFDPSFANRGFENYKISDSDFEYGKKVKIVGDKILVTGYSGYKGFIMRLNQNGELDESFGNEGIGFVLTNLLATINDFIIVPLINTYDIIGAGTYIDGFESKPALIKFTENGYLLTSFGTDGRATPSVPIKGYFNNITSGINTVYASGTKHSDGVLDDDALICKFDLNGEPKGYNIIKDPIGEKRNNLNSLYISQSNEIIFCGDFDSDSGTSAYICKLESDGNIDRTFGDSGYRYTNQTHLMSSLAVQSDGKIILGGTSDLLGNEDFNLIRLNSEGTDDLTFNNTSWTLTDFNEGNDQIEGLVIQKDGKLIAVGNSNNTLDNIVVARYLLDNSSGIKSITKSNFKFSAYPNLIQNNETNISYQLPNNDNIQVSIFSIDGHKSTTIINGIRNEGKHNQRVMLPENLKPGIYYLQLSTLTAREVVKIIKM